VYIKDHRDVVPINIALRFCANLMLTFDEDGRVVDIYPASLSVLVEGCDLKADIKAMAAMRDAGKKSSAACRA
jgi:hypothetical protein